MVRTGWLSLAIATATILTGCLPFGDKSESTELFPADSLSRTIAAAVVPTTLTLVARVEPEGPSFFSSIQLAPDSLIWIGDLSASSIRRFTLTGDEQPAIRSEDLAYPYLAGRTEATSFVYDVGTESLLRFDGDNLGAAFTLPARTGGVSLSRFVSVQDGYAYVKDTGSHDSATIAVSRIGEPPTRKRLPGESWRYHGILRPWGKRMAGVSSFRPVMYFFDPSARVDSMFLSGFDSPMLARSRSFELGETPEPPLMISSLFAIGERLFILNVRPGTLRIDEYDSAGTLNKIFQREAPQPESYTPVDLLVLSDLDGRLRFYVISASTEYGALSLDYKSRLDLLTPAAAPETL